MAILTVMASGHLHNSPTTVHRPCIVSNVGGTMAVHRKAMPTVASKCGYAVSAIPCINTGDLSEGSLAVHGYRPLTSEPPNMHEDTNIHPAVGRSPRPTRRPTARTEW